MTNLSKGLAFVLFGVFAVNAQQAPATTTSTAAASTAATSTATAPTDRPQPAAVVPTPATPNSSGESRVVFVEGIPKRNGGTVHLRDEIRIGVRGYGKLHGDAAARQQPITLWINGIDSKLPAIGINPYTAAIPKMTPSEREDARVLTFFLTRTSKNADLWRDILRNPFFEPEGRLALSVGVSEGAALLLDKDAEGTPVNGTLTFQKRFFAWPAVFWALLVIAVIFAVFWLRSDMLRNGPEINGQKQAYSLGRSQMAWWFILIVASYITIWLITGDRDTITPELLVLMGISAATAMGSIAIEAAAPGRANDARKELEEEKKQLQVSPTMAVGKAQTATLQEQAAAAALTLRIAEIDNTLTNVVKPAMTTRSWLRDVLTDNNGVVALHRFQVLVWTIVLGLVFLTSVLRDLSMPEFSSTLLALMGISAGTYLGFKLPTNGG